MYVKEFVGIESYNGLMWGHRLIIETKTGPTDQNSITKFRTQFLSVVLYYFYAFMLLLIALLKRLVRRKILENI